MQNKNSEQAIFNPSRAAGLSFLFTPIFGSYLQSANWRTLGQPERAASSKAWLYVSLVVLALMGASTVLFGGKSAAGNDAVRMAVNGGGFVYFLIWYFGSARAQVRFVKETFGKEYTKRPITKPVLVALLCAVLYGVVVFGLLIAKQPSDEGDDSAGQEVSSAPASASPGPLATLSGFFASGPKLDCAADSVKQTITGIYTDQLIKTRIPDLIWAVEDKHVTVRVETIREVARNNQSKNADCAATLSIDFPQADLDRATQQGEIFVDLMQLGGFTLLNSSTFATGLTYQVAVPADANEKKQGLIVTMTTNRDRASDQQLKTFATYYEALSLSQPDISAKSTNATAWSKDYRDNAIQTCGQSADVAKCACEMDAFAKVANDLETARITFAVQLSPVFAKRYVNYAKLTKALNEQCPMHQSLAELLGGDAAASATAANPDEAASSPDQVAQSAPAPATQQAPAVETKVDAVQPPQSAIVASFDCAKASSKIEKLICSAPETANADTRLASSYKAALAKASDPTALRQQQREWISKERNACDDAACLTKVTDARIQALSTM